jgi:hypothetical protein
VALAAIQAENLYRQNYTSWEHYLRDRWGFGRARLAQLKGASRIMKSLEQLPQAPRLTIVNNGQQPPRNPGPARPANEAQARPLGRLKDPAQRQAALDLARATAEAEGRGMTARDVAVAAQAQAREEAAARLRAPDLRTRRIRRALSHLQQAAQAQAREVEHLRQAWNAIRLEDRASAARIKAEIGAARQRAFTRNELRYLTRTYRQ